MDKCLCSRCPVVTDCSLEYMEPWTGFMSDRVLSCWKMRACASSQAIFSMLLEDQIGLQEVRWEQV